MFTTYVLYSPKYNKIYIGFSSNFEARLLSHNKLSKKGYTYKFRPWEVVLTENFDVKSDAMKREKQLKQAKSRADIWKIIEEKYS